MAEENRVIGEVGKVIASIHEAKLADQVICALHSIAACLFPFDSSLVSGCVDERYREQILAVKPPGAKERCDLWRAFYLGSAFRTLARVLLLDVASNWLACLPLAAQKHVYDIFFLNGLATEVVQVLVPFLRQSASDALDVHAIQTNTERLLVLVLVENEGALQIASEFSVSGKQQITNKEKLKAFISEVAQVIISIPDKARLRAPPSLSSHLFFKQIIQQLLSGLEEAATITEENAIYGTLLFVGDVFGRICRRGSSDVLLSEITPQILRHVRSCLSSDEMQSDAFGSNLNSQIWSKLMEAVTDPFAIERFAEQLLHQIASQQTTEDEAYWTVWVLFHQLIKYRISVRRMFVDKFLLWKVFPLCSLRLVLHFAVLEKPPAISEQIKDKNSYQLLETVRCLAVVWSNKDFVQSASIEQQAYVTAGLGLCLEKMSKDELDQTKDVMRSILDGVRCRLENPTDLVRKMGASIALAFSIVIDPNNPLYLDDSYHGETIDWEFGLSTTKKGTSLVMCSTEPLINGAKETNLAPANILDSSANATQSTEKKTRCKKLSLFSPMDPDEIIDPASLDYESVSDKDDLDNASEDNDSSSQTSLEPYDLTDDDVDLRRKMPHIVDVVGALRKSDDADGVQRALDVVETLIRASPDELMHIAGYLARTLVQVRCSDLAVEGEEESAEEKRQRALVALLVTCPFDSLDALNKLLYSPNVDVSQRVMILDVMTEAAQELANAKIMTQRLNKKHLVSEISDTKMWFLPCNAAPAGAGPWKEIGTSGTLLNWSSIYERELPLKHGHVRKGKTRIWSLKNEHTRKCQVESIQNKFPMYAAAFMLPAMRGYDKRRHGVDLLGRDFIVLGKLIYMLGVCMKCAAMHPEASTLALNLLDMLRSRTICYHKEAYVRRAVLYAASCLLVAIHPSFVASALIEAKHEVSEGLEWLRTWVLEVADSDTDRECYTMAISCLQLHSEMALQASRALEAAQSSSTMKAVANSSKGAIKIPYSNR